MTEPNRLRPDFAGTPSGGPVILSVDDRPDNLFIIREILREFMPDARVFTAGNAAEGEAAALAYPPDIALIDVQMPEVSGIELCRRLKGMKGLEGTRMILMTAHRSAPHLRAEGLDAGAVDFISKPVDNRELMARIRANLREKEEEDRLREQSHDLARDVAAGRQALAESRERHHIMFAASRDAVFMLDEALRIREVNPAAETLMGKAAVDLLGRDFASCMADPDRIDDKGAALAPEKLGPMLDWACAPVNGELPEAAFRRKDGDIRHGEISATRMQIGGSEYIHALVRDVTERRRAGKELKRLEEQLLQSRKMEAVGTLAGGIAHDFNNVLSIMLGNLELANDGAERAAGMASGLPEKLERYLSERLPRYLSEAQTAGLRAREMIQSLLRFSRRSREDECCVSPLNPEPAIREAVGLLRATIPNSIELNLTVSPEIPAVMIHTARIHQILLNLCTNASHAIGKKAGEITITAEPVMLIEPPAAAYITDSPSPGRYLELRVSDTGDGIPPDLLSRIFDPYFTTKEVGKGTGMGLAVVQGIVSSAGGCVAVDSKEGSGTEIRLFMPEAPSCEQEEGAAAGSAEESGKEEKIKGKHIKGEERKTADASSGTKTGDGQHILYVDDETAVLDMNRMRLERMGYRVTTAVSGAEALKILEADPDGVDLLITDMSMPVMTGTELVDRVQEIRPDMPAIICTGHANSLPFDKEENEAKLQVLTKPVMKDQMIEAICSALDF